MLCRRPRIIAASFSGRKKLESTSLPCQQPTCTCGTRAACAMTNLLYDSRTPTHASAMKPTIVHTRIHGYRLWVVAEQTVTVTYMILALPLLAWKCFEVLVSYNKFKINADTFNPCVIIINHLTLDNIHTDCVQCI